MSYLSGEESDGTSVIVYKCSTIGQGAATRSISPIFWDENIDDDIFFQPKKLSHDVLLELESDPFSSFLFPEKSKLLPKPKLNRNALLRARRLDLKQVCSVAVPAGMVFDPLADDYEEDSFADFMPSLPSSGSSKGSTGIPQDAFSPTRQAAGQLAHSVTTSTPILSPKARSADAQGLSSSNVTEGRERHDSYVVTSSAVGKLKLRLQHDQQSAKKPAAALDETSPAAVKQRKRTTVPPAERARRFDDVILAVLEGAREGVDPGDQQMDVSASSTDSLETEQVVPFACSVKRPVPATVEEATAAGAGEETEAPPKKLKKKKHTAKRSSGEPCQSTPVDSHSLLARKQSSVSSNGDRLDALSIAIGPSGDRAAPIVPLEAEVSPSTTESPAEDAERFSFDTAEMSEQPSATTQVPELKQAPEPKQVPEPKPVPTPTTSSKSQGKKPVQQNASKTKSGAFKRDPPQKMCLKSTGPPIYGSGIAIAKIPKKPQPNILSDKRVERRLKKARDIVKKTFGKGQGKGKISQPPAERALVKPVAVPTLPLDVKMQIQESQVSKVQKWHLFARQNSLKTFRETFNNNLSNLVPCTDFLGLYDSSGLSDMLKNMNAKITKSLMIHRRNCLPKEPVASDDVPRFKDRIPYALFTKNKEKLTGPTGEVQKWNDNKMAEVRARESQAHRLDECLNNFQVGKLNDYRMMENSVAHVYLYGEQSEYGDVSNSKSDMLRGIYDIPNPDRALTGLAQFVLAARMNKGVNRKLAMDAGDRMGSSFHFTPVVPEQGIEYQCRFGRYRPEGDENRDSPAESMLSGPSMIDYPQHPQPASIASRNSGSLPSLSAASGSPYVDFDASPYQHSPSDSGFYSSDYHHHQQMPYSMHSTPAIAAPFFPGQFPFPHNMQIAPPPPPLPPPLPPGDIRIPSPPAQ